MKDFTHITLIHEYFDGLECPDLSIIPANNLTEEHIRLKRVNIEKNNLWLHPENPKLSFWICANQADFFLYSKIDQWQPFHYKKISLSHDIEQFTLDDEGFDNHSNANNFVLLDVCPGKNKVVNFLSRCCYWKYQVKGNVSEFLNLAIEANEHYQEHQENQDCLFTKTLETNELIEFKSTQKITLKRKRLSSFQLNFSLGDSGKQVLKNHLPNLGPQDLYKNDHGNSLIAIKQINL